MATVDGLFVPKSAPFYKWTGSEIAGEALGRLGFSNARFLTGLPDPGKFKKPADAVAAPT